MSLLSNHVAEDVGVLIISNDVFNKLSLLHLLDRQSHRPVVPLSVLKQIFLVVEVSVQTFAVSILNRSRFTDCLNS